MSRFGLWGLMMLLATLPATSTYKLNSYGFGNGTASTKTTTYSLEGVSGELNGQPASTANSGSQPGFIQTEHANVPQLSDLDNNGGIYYNKLHLVINNQNNPTDATFLVSVSTDNFASVTDYLQPDGTLSTTLNTSDYQTYSAWGGSSGSLIIGLQPSTTYYVRVRATQGKFSESAFGPISSQATAGPTISFNLQTSSGPTPPYTVSLGTLSGGSISSGAQTIDTSLSTNATSGGDVYLTSKNGGLRSASQGFLITSASGDLSSLNDGFGVQNNSITQTSGGPFTVLSPYNGSGNTVGIVNATTRSLYTSAVPITGGSAVLAVKAKAATTDVAATDYSETLTFTASANF